jgi:hypothetical protein
VESYIQVTNLPSTIINIGMAELDDLNDERRRDKDRFSLSKQESQTKQSAESAVAKPPATATVKPEKFTQIHVNAAPPSNIIANITSTQIAYVVDVGATGATGATDATGSIEETESMTGATGATGINHPLQEERQEQ